MDIRDEKKAAENKLNPNALVMGKNISLAMHLCESEIASQWLHEKTMTISNPLVVILGIGEYDGMPNLIGITKDYQNMIIIFNKLFKYDILYKLSNNKYNNNKSQGNVKDSFKLKWSCNEIDEFIDDIKELLGNDDKKYDSLLFIISCHGEAEGLILDSECEEYSLFALYSEFNGIQLADFAHCPKLFMVDACRGRMKSPKVPVSYKLDVKLQELMVYPKGISDKSKFKPSGNDDIDDSKYNKQSQLSEQKINIHSEANFFFVYANPEGYAAFDGGNKGGYLIQAIYKVFKKKEILSKNLDSIILHVAEKVKQLVGLQSMQHVQTVSNVHYRINFRPQP